MSTIVLGLMSAGASMGQTNKHQHLLQHRLSVHIDKCRAHSNSLHTLKQVWTFVEVVNTQLTKWEQLLLISHSLCLTCTAHSVNMLASISRIHVLAQRHLPFSSAILPNLPYGQNRFCAILPCFLSSCTLYFENNPLCHSSSPQWQKAALGNGERGFATCQSAAYGQQKPPESVDETWQQGFLGKGNDGKTKTILVFFGNWTFSGCTAVFHYAAFSD